MSVRTPLLGATELRGTAEDHDGLLERIGDRRFVLLGEATHGSHELYRGRARITRRLIEEKGFDVVAIEGDWPDARRVDRYATGRSDDRDAAAALGGFTRFPSWMWRNRDVERFVTWLRAHNATLSSLDDMTRFCGLDLYSLRTSMAEVVRYLDTVDPDAAAHARERYSCFEHVGGEGTAYGRSVHLDLALPCEDEVVAVLVDLVRRTAAILARDGREAEDDLFSAEQNARLVHDAETYYREMYRGRASSWNLRDEHMTSTLAAMVAHLDRRGRRTKVVVWAHNSHVGDARATEMGAHGEVNVGQLVRQRWPDDSVLVGFTTDHGTVTAASEWGGPAERKRVRPALEGSYENLLHQVGGDLLLLLEGRAGSAFAQPRLERAIGVIYRPETERSSHWFRTRLSHQFDAIVHINRTTAVEPFERTVLWDVGEPPDTFPTGL